MIGGPYAIEKYRSIFQEVAPLKVAQGLQSGVCCAASCHATFYWAINKRTHHRAINNNHVLLGTRKSDET